MRKCPLPADPFVSIGAIGIGELIKTAVERGRTTRLRMKHGIGGGDPASISFRESGKLD